MIGTPNSGSPVSVWYFTGCPPGSHRDLFAGSAATLVVDRPQSTHYYTLVGNWLPDKLCPTGVFGVLVTDGVNVLFLAMMMTFWYRFIAPGQVLFFTILH